MFGGGGGGGGAKGVSNTCMSTDEYVLYAHIQTSI